MLGRLLEAGKAADFQVGDLVTIDLLSDFGNKSLGGVWRIKEKRDDVAVVEPIDEQAKADLAQHWPHAGGSVVFYYRRFTRVSRTIDPFGGLEVKAESIVDQMQPHGLTADNYPYFRTDQLDPEDIANFADGAADENFDVDMRTLQDGSEIMVLVPKDQSDEPLAAMDIDRKAHSAADKGESVSDARLGELWDDAEARIKWFYIRDVLRDKGASVRVALEYADKCFKLTWEELPDNVKNILISTVDRNL